MKKMMLNISEYVSKNQKKIQQMHKPTAKKTDIKNVINILKINNPLFSFIESIKIKMMKNKFSFCGFLFEIFL